MKGKNDSKKKKTASISPIIQAFISNYPIEDSDEEEAERSLPSMHPGIDVITGDLPDYLKKAYVLAMVTIPRQINELYLEFKELQEKSREKSCDDFSHSTNIERVQEDIESNRHLVAILEHLFRTHLRRTVDITTLQNYVVELKKGFQVVRIAKKDHKALSILHASGRSETGVIKISSGFGSGFDIFEHLFGGPGGLPSAIIEAIRKQG